MTCIKDVERDLEYHHHPAGSAFINMKFTTAFSTLAFISCAMVRATRLSVAWEQWTDKIVGLGHP